MGSKTTNEEREVELWKLERIGYVGYLRLLDIYSKYYPVRVGKRVRAWRPAEDLIQAILRKDEAKADRRRRLEQLTTSTYGAGVLAELQRQALNRAGLTSSLDITFDGMIEQILAIEFSEVAVSKR